MFSYFFLVITSFWVLKPIKKGLFIEYYDLSGVAFGGWILTASQAELVAKILNMLVAFVAVIVFTMLSRKLHRQQLTNVFSLFIIVCLFVFSRLLLQPGDLTVWSFYLFGDLFSTLMVVTFFAFLNDSMTPDSAKRLYGIIGLGGVMGGVFGSTFVTIWFADFSTIRYLSVIVLLLLGVWVGAAVYAGRQFRSRSRQAQEVNSEIVEEH